jgi:hypothetical protein
MDCETNNPHQNTLPPGITEEKFAEAVRRSGYPLQSEVVRELQPHFHALQEEWSYVDRDSGELRAADILATVHMWDWERDQQPRVRPKLQIVIECKQWELPAVFFRSQAATSAHVGDLPLLTGLRSPVITVTTDDDPSSYMEPAQACLGLDKHAFVAQAPFVCTSFSRCVRKSSDLELSGADVYNGAVLPLVKALVHLNRTAAPRPNRVYFDCTATLALCILDAPMTGVSVGEGGGSESKLIPWARLLRHEAVTRSEDESASDPSAWSVYGIDFVHRHFLHKYVCEHVIPFGREFGRRVLARGEVLASGKGFARGLGARYPSDLYAALQPRSPFTSAARARSVLGALRSWGLYDRVGAALRRGRRG